MSLLESNQIGLDLILVNQTGRKLALTLARGSEVRAFSCFNAPSRKFPARTGIRAFPFSGLAVLLR